MKPKKILTSEEKLAKKRQSISKERRHLKDTLAMYGIVKSRKPPKKYDPWRDG